MRKNRNVIDDLEEDENTVRDGEKVTVRLDMMDAVQRSIFDTYGHCPGYARMTDAQQQRRAEARDSYIKRTENAWRTARDQAPDDDPDEDNEDNGDSPARRAYLDRLKNAWRTPTGFAGSVGPTNVGALPSNRIGVGDRRALLSKDAADAQRNTAWNDYVTRLNNAWRSP